MKGHHKSIGSDSTLSEDFESDSLPPPRYDQIYHASHDPETAEAGVEGLYHIRGIYQLLTCSSTNSADCRYFR